MRRTTLVSAESAAPVPRDGEPGALKVFFSYAPCSGTTTAMLDEAQGLMGSGRDVFVADPARPAGGRVRAFDLDQVLARRPDVVVLEDLARPNPEGARNRTRYQDAEELLRAGIDVYATLRVSDLQNEQDRVRALGVEVPPEPVPDHLFYGARQLEFVDIDPAELVARAKTAGREVPGRVLNELRVLALRCVSEYAASAGSSQAVVPGARRTAHAVRGRMVAVVEPGASPGRVLLEAERLAAAGHAELEVVCVRRAQRAGSPRAAREDARHAQLQERVEAMGHELTTFFGDDPAETVRDYLRTQGASDLVAARRRLPWIRRVAAVVRPSFEERAVEGLSGVNVHLVSDDDAARPPRTPVRTPGSARGLRGRDAAAVVAAPCAALLVACVLQSAGFGEATSYVVFFAASVAAAVATRAYVPTLAAVALGCLAEDYFFIRPYLDLSVDHRANLMAFVAFALASAAASLAVARVGKAAERSDRRERRTQALFDLNRSLVYAHGTVETVDVALDSTARLFGRSAALYLHDPFGPAGRARRGPTVREAEGDLDAAVFAKLSEQSVAHWVFANGEPAGSGTDTHAASDACYLPLLSEEGVEGVLAVSDRRRLSPADRSFLDLVAGQVSVALERQALAAKHRDDLREMHATHVRSVFMGGIAASMRAACDTVHALSDALLGVAEDDRAYRDALVRALLEESSRGLLMADRMRGVLEAPVSASCDVRAEVAAAVDEVREGLSGKVIDLQPGEDVPSVAADAALVRAAAKLVLEAAASYVGPRGIVQVGVGSYPDRVSVVVADDRPSEAGSSRAAAFELSASGGEGNGLVYDGLRARGLRALLLDREAAVESGQDEFLAALCRALRLSEGAVRSDGSFNRRRILRFDRLEYGLYMAALIVRAHGGTIKQRYRLGGGAVVTFTLPCA